MPSVTELQDRKALRLTHVDFDGVEYDLFDENGKRLRPVRVPVTSGASWRESIRFPAGVYGEAGLSTGDPELDEEIRARAAEEMVRLEAATRALRAAA
jgi:hypothetical protein